MSKTSKAKVTVDLTPINKGVIDCDACIDFNSMDQPEAITVVESNGLADHRLGVGSAEQEERPCLLLQLGSEERHESSGHAPLGHAAVRPDIADHLDEPMLVVECQEGPATVTQRGGEQFHPQIDAAVRGAGRPH